MTCSTANLIGKERSKRVITKFILHLGAFCWFYPIVGVFFEAAHLARWQLLEIRSSQLQLIWAHPLLSVLLNCSLVNIRTEPNSIYECCLLVVACCLCVLKIFTLHLEGSSIVYFIFLYMINICINLLKDAFIPNI